MEPSADKENVLPAGQFTNSGLSHQLSDPPNEEEITKALESPHVFGSMKKKKKELVKPVTENLEAILRRLNRVDATLGEMFRVDLPASVMELESKNYNARMLAERLVSIKNRWSVHPGLETKAFQGDKLINGMFMAINGVCNDAKAVAHDTKMVLSQKLMVVLKGPL
jgi:hypothetical protein